MKMIRSALPVVVAIVATWGLTTASGIAQSNVPNGVFVQESNGWIWLVLEGQRVTIPVWAATDAEIAVLPKSNRWAVMNDQGAIVAGDPPTWLVPGGDAPLSGQRSPQVPAVLPPVRTSTPVGWEVLTDVAGQTATVAYGSSGQPIRATVREMTIMKTIPAARGFSTRYEARTAIGKFVIVLVDVENVGTKPQGVVLGHMLKDARGRVFNGDTNRADAKVQHAVLAVYPIEIRDDDLQPNLVVPRVFVYDVPTDATGFVLSSDR